MSQTGIYLNYESVLIDLLGILKFSDLNGKLTAALAEEGTIDPYRSFMEIAQRMLRNDGLIQKMESTWQVMADPELSEVELMDHGYEIQAEGEGWVWYHAESATVSDTFMRKCDAMREAEIAIESGQSETQKAHQDPDQDGITVVLQLSPNGGRSGWISMRVTRDWIDRVTSAGQGEMRIKADNAAWSLPHILDKHQAYAVVAEGKFYVGAASVLDIAHGARAGAIACSNRASVDELRNAFERSPRGHVVPLGVPPYPSEAAIALMQDYCSRLSSAQSNYRTWLKIETQAMGFTTLTEETPRVDPHGTMVVLDGYQLTTESVPTPAQVSIRLTEQDVENLRELQLACVRENNGSIRCGHLKQQWDLPPGHDGKDCVQPLVCVYADGSVTFSSRNVLLRQIWITHRVDLDDLQLLVTGEGTGTLFDETSVRPAIAL